MSDFPFKVGDRVRQAGWRDGYAGIITAIGREVILVIGEESASTEWVYSKRDKWELAPEPKPEKPEWLDDAWINVYPGGVALLASHASASRADAYAESYRIGRVCVGTGEWVPCRGQEVAA